MKQIKTVIRAIYCTKQFDDEVNNLIATGWRLVKREPATIPELPTEAFNTTVLNVLYAELEKDIPPYPEEVTQ